MTKRQKRAKERAEAKKAKEKAKLKAEVEVKKAEEKAKAEAKAKAETDKKKITPRVVAVKKGGVVENLNKTKPVKKMGLMEEACRFHGVKMKNVENYQRVDDNTIILCMLPPNAVKLRYERGQKK